MTTLGNPFLLIDGYRDQNSCAKGCERQVPSNGCSTAVCFCRPENFIVGLNGVRDCIYEECTNINVEDAAESARVVAHNYCKENEVPLESEMFPGSTVAVNPSTIDTTTLKPTPTPTTIDVITQVRTTRTLESSVVVESITATVGVETRTPTTVAEETGSAATGVTEVTATVTAEAGGSGGGLTVGQGVGIGIGIAGALALAAGIGFFFWRRRRNTGSVAPAGAEVASPRPYEEGKANPYYVPPVAEVPGEDWRGVELESRETPAQRY